MNRSDTEQNSASGVVVASTANTRLTGSWLLIARVLWLALVIPSLGFCVASLLVTYQQLQRVPAGALTVQGLQALSTLGLSVSGYATLFTIFYAINCSDLVRSRLPHFLAQV